MSNNHAPIPGLGDHAVGFPHSASGWGVLAFTLVFGAELIGILHWGFSLGAAQRRVAEEAGSIELHARETSSLSKQIRAQAQELVFLQSLPNILPKERNTLRTQKVVAAEVQTLRTKVGSRLHGALHVVVDAKANVLYLKKGLKLLWQADCSVGRGGVLKDKRTGRRWEFVTPRGEFRVRGKRENPVWHKPDWAFVESGQPVPPPEDPLRQAQGELGAYVLDLGDGYLIHGTKDEAGLGRPVSHGCVRLGVEDLAKLYQEVPVGTKVYIIY
ncbi:MAG: L,D-transpeptidase [Elusimicrobiota bacterium]|jgi:L,D-transpeptidase YbiS